MSYRLGPGPTMESFEQVKSDIAFIEDTDIATRNISKGQYVLWKGDLCQASSNISAGDLLSSSNLTAKPNGISNEVALLNDHLVKLNSNLSSLKMWIGTASFVFSNTDNSSVDIADICSVQSTNIVGLSCIPTGYARGTFGMDSGKSKIIMQAHQVYNLTLNAMIVLFYT